MGFSYKMGKWPSGDGERLPISPEIPALTQCQSANIKGVRGVMKHPHDDTSSSADYRARLFARLARAFPDGLPVDGIKGYGTHAQR
jgi:hypothetical protein